ncbi:MAG: hypothetical protein AB8H86_09205 [Polyangiales bacterium]
MNNRVALGIPLFICASLAACGDDAAAPDAGADIGVADAPIDVTPDVRIERDAALDAPDDAGADVPDAVANVYFVDPGGDDTSEGNETSPLRTVAEAVRRVAARSHVLTPTIRLARGSYAHMGQLTLSDPVILEGVSRDESTLQLELTREDAGVRVLAPNVTIRDLEISVYLAESLSDGIHEGGRGEYGTGITLGEYLAVEQQVAVDGIVLERLRISRPSMAPAINYTAAALTMVGRVQNVSVEDIDLLGNHSTALILHWGAHSTVAPAPGALADPAYDVIESYHPHSIVVRQVRVERSARFLIISSSYDVEISGVEGATREILFMLPGDEGDNFAVEGDRGRANSDITVTNIRASLSVGPNTHAIRLSSVGTSKVPATLGDKVRYSMRNIELSDITVTEVTRRAGESFRYGINAGGMTGENIVLRNIDLSDLASLDYEDPDRGVLPSYGLYMRETTGLRVSQLQSRGRYGIGIVDARDILVEDSDFSYRASDSTRASYGIFIRDGSEPELSNDAIELRGLRVSDYESGIRYAGTDRCAELTLEELTFTGTDAMSVEVNGACL